MTKNRIDQLGRVYIPKKHRMELGFLPGDPLCFSVDKAAGHLIIEKQVNACLCCNSEENLLILKPGLFLCENCAQKITTCFSK